MAALIESVTPSSASDPELELAATTEEAPALEPVLYAGLVLLSCFDVRWVRGQYFRVSGV